ncbi:BlaI/MecI/CopY family transcriptional regulator [Longimicrobium sp.]|uniref:BlaI/MecI/CopY family transcriptional regulator n=1 Tax=Longimicrobium sp. TaxID=2029185 RepID=UPI002C67A9E7|nr:BlaI/MecI/CopY family transcriptional regulator [Longimicrobium sp.]HSU17954.1 BlaI/MecI/CopY family transcriptional regulator [Longimicrobium sp.]
MSDAPDLTDLQLAVLRVLWERGEATVQEIHAGLLDERGLAPTTVATLLTRLERRGVVSRRADGRVHRYRARVTEPEVRRSMVGGLASRLFGGDVAAMVSHLLGGEHVGADDLERIRALVEKRERELKEGHDG